METLLSNALKSVEGTDDDNDDSVQCLRLIQEKLGADFSTINSEDDSFRGMLRQRKTVVVDNKKKIVIEINVESRRSPTKDLVLLSL